MINGHHHKGKFIVVEGIDGSGKSTVVQAIKAYLTDKGIKCAITREPGGTALGENLRNILLHSNLPITPETAVLLHYASRCQHLQEFVLDALNNGYWVISDRFEDSTFAYQCGGEGVDVGYVGRVSEVVLGGFKPDLVIYLDAPVEVCLNRLSGEKDNYEQQTIEFFKRTRALYKYRAIQPHRRMVNAENTEHEVQAAVLHHVKQLHSKVIENVT